MQVVAAHEVTMKLLKRSLLTAVLTALFALPSLADVSFGINLGVNDPYYNHWSPIGGQYGWYHHAGDFYHHEYLDGTWGYRRQRDNFWMPSAVGMVLGETLTPVGVVAERVTCGASCCR